MKLKDVNINAEDLLKFFNEHIAFEQDQSVDERGFTLKFYYKMEVSELAEFIKESASKYKTERIIPNTTPDQRSIHPSL
ncbi:hypothetical protein OWR28_02555 [Chryseobacterium sp. 1B4]